MLQKQQEEADALKREEALLRAEQEYAEAIREAKIRELEEEKKRFMEDLLSGDLSDEE